MWPIRTILHPTDFSVHSGCAYRVALALAHNYGARLIVLHVATPPAAICAEGAPSVDPEAFREMLHEQLLRMLAVEACVPMAYRLVDGDAATEILRAAKQSRCDLIVMGARGRTSLGRLLIGSVAERVMRKAACPVLTVKTPGARTEPACAARCTARERAVEALARS
jgi:nucleotide-binding universal stress UspA family protein